MFYTYMLASQKNGTLYIGHTEDLTERVRQHREKVHGGFTAKYSVERLVWWELHHDRNDAFQRERQIKKWRRVWKIRTVEAANPDWRDLYDELSAPGQPLHPDLAAAGITVTGLDPRMRGDERRQG